MRTRSLKKNKINVVTLGCSKNVYDSEVLMGQLKANNKTVAHEEEGNIVVINTCGFSDSVKKAADAIGWGQKRGKLPLGRGVGCRLRLLQSSELIIHAL